MIWQIIAIGMMWVASVLVAAYYAYNTGYASALSWSTRTLRNIAKELRESKDV